MPQGLSTVVIGKLTVGAILATAATVAATSMVIAATQRSGRVGSARRQLDTEARHRTVVAPVTPARWILGEQRVGGIKVFEDTRELEAAAEDMTRTAVVDHWQVLVLGEAPLDSVRRWWIDGEEIGMVSEGDDVALGRWQPPVGHRWRGHLEAWAALDGSGNVQGEGLKALRAAFPDDWTEAHRGLGVAWLLVHSTQPAYEGTDDPDTRRVFTTWPIVEVLVRGLKITWPGQAAATWTRNAAAIRWWWHVSKKGEPLALQDEPSARAAVALCAEDVTVALPPQYSGYGDTFSRYGCDMTILGTDTPEEVEDELDYQWIGQAPIGPGGRRLYLPGAERPASVVLREGDILERGPVRAWVPLQDRVNAARLTLAQSRYHDYTQLDVPELADGPQIARDGRKLPVDLGVRGAETDPVSAVFKLAQHLRRARSSSVREYRLAYADRRYLEAPVGSIWTVNDGEAGLDATVAEPQRFRLISTRTNEDRSQSVTLEEERPGTWTDSVQLPPLIARAWSPVLDTTPPGAVADLVVEDEESVNLEGTLVSLLRIRWRPTPWNTAVLVTGPDGFQWERTAPGASATARVPAEGVYGVRVAHVSRAGVEGPATMASHTVDWRSLAPSPLEVVEVRYAGGVVEVIGQIEGEEPDIRGAEVLYRSEDLESDLAIPEITEQQWVAFYSPTPPAGVRRAGGLTVLPSRGRQLLVIRFTVPESGRYRLYGRLVNQLGVQSATVEIGEYAISTQVETARTRIANPLWPGELLGMDVLPRPEGDPEALLVVDAALTTDGRAPSATNIALSSATINGDNGWPCGPAPTPTETSTPRLTGVPVFSSLVGPTAQALLWATSPGTLDAVRSRFILAGDGQQGGAGFVPLPVDPVIDAVPLGGGDVSLIDASNTVALQLGVNTINNVSKPRFEEVWIAVFGGRIVLTRPAQRPADINQAFGYAAYGWTPALTGIYGKLADRRIFGDPGRFVDTGFALPRAAAWPYLIIFFQHVESSGVRSGFPVLIETGMLTGEDTRAAATARQAVNGLARQGSVLNGLGFGDTPGAPGVARYARSAATGGNLLAAIPGRVSRRVVVYGLSPTALTAEVRSTTAGSTGYTPAADIDALIVSTEDPAIGAGCSIVRLKTLNDTRDTWHTIWCGGMTLQLRRTTAGVIEWRADPRSGAHSPATIRVRGFDLGAFTSFTGAAGYRMEVEDAERVANYEARMRVGFFSPIRSALASDPDTSHALEIEGAEDPAALATAEDRLEIGSDVWVRFPGVRYFQGACILEDGFTNAALRSLSLTRRQVL